MDQGTAKDGRSGGSCPGRGSQSHSELFDQEFRSPKRRCEARDTGDRKPVQLAGVWSANTSVPIRARPSRDSRECSEILGQVSGGALAASWVFLRAFAYVRKMKTKIPILDQY